jgi:hypothetical protein
MVKHNEITETSEESSKLRKRDALQNSKQNTFSNFLSLPISPCTKAATTLTFLPVMEIFSLQRQEGA